MAKKKVKDAPPGSPAWMTTYGDMMTLLLCFFVMLISMSSMEVAKIQQAAASLKGALSALPFQERVMPSPPKEIQRPSRGERKGRKSKALAKLKKVIRENQMENIISVRQNEQGIHLTIGDPALFETGKADIKQKILPVLNQILEILSEAEDIIRVEGHTDNVPIHNDTFRDNWELSVARSLSVIRYIKNRQNIDPRRLRPVGCGEFHPVESNSTEEGRALNRRVEIYIEMGD